MRLRPEWRLRQDDEGRWYVEIETCGCGELAERVEGSYATIQGAIAAAYRWEATEDERERQREAYRRESNAEIKRRIESGEEVTLSELFGYHLSQLRPTLPLFSGPPNTDVNEIKVITWPKYGSLT